ncbi:hypothetical protein EV368DRAFT_81173 [Lentinula lateritia]|nr:hypothetical protein EV368DRAFT_81173 [Lentinula lateritia]
MSSALPSRSDSSRNWWSLSSKGSTREPSSFPQEKAGRPSSSKRNDNTKFNTLASAFGLKTKKHPSLTIEDPPATSFPSHHELEPLYSPELSPKYTNRPPSKSVSSTRSRVDSIEPRTPSDGQRDSASNRHSLLTLSDIDPFAARSGIAVPHSPIDPNRLSAYSGSSVVPEYITKKLDDVPVAASRVSYASSSSHSFSPDDMASLSPPSSLYFIAEKPPKKLSQKKSLGDLGQRTNRSKLDEFPPGMIKSNSSVTLTDKNRLSHPEIFSAPRPPMRARGMTDAAAIYRLPNFLQDDRSATNLATFSPSSPSSPPPVSPRVVIRQPSLQRMGLPISAPPSHRLPPPPVPVDVTDDQDVDPLRFSNSASSSTTSFKSERDTGMVNQHYILRSRPREREFRPVEDTIQKSRTLKKAVSHQSLSKMTSSSATSVSTPPPMPEKGPRKQRSFHHPRIPLPQMPSLKHHSSGSAVPLLDGPEPKRGSMNGPPTPSRKRLFSGSSTRRPSTSQETWGEDDHRSVFSLDREKSTPISPISTKPSSHSSFWDESGADATPSSPRASTMDYTPQQIMSPAEMLKLEADVRESLSLSRSRGMSIVSSSTVASESDSTSPLPSLMSSIRSHGLLNTQPHPIRSNSMGSGGMVVTPRLPRPSTGQSVSSATLSNTISTPGLVSLPPPPRSRRPLPTSNAPEPSLKALSPPPRTKVVNKTISNDKLNRRTPLTRKSSFLDIDGDLASNQLSSPSIPLHGGDSFLDLARESLDTVRSDTDEEQF